MKRAASLAAPVFIRPSREIDWSRNLTISKRIGSKKVDVFEWAVWTLVSLSLALAVLWGVVLCALPFYLMAR